MTHITIQIPARVTVAPRAADPLANAALAVGHMVRRLGVALLSGLRSRHLLAQGAGHAAEAETPCENGIGSIKG
jgi:hypothetical protein